MARLNDFMTRIDLSVLNDYAEANLCADFHALMGHLSHRMSIIFANFAYGNTLQDIDFVCWLCSLLQPMGAKS